MPKHKPPPIDLTETAKSFNMRPMNGEPMMVKPKTGALTTVGFNWEDWIPYLDEMNGTDAQKRELIETLWAIVMSFMDLNIEITDKPSGSNFDLSGALKAAVIGLKEEKQKEEV